MVCEIDCKRCAISISEGTGQHVSRIIMEGAWIANTHPIQAKTNRSSSKHVHKQYT